VESGFSEFGPAMFWIVVVVVVVATLWRRTTLQREMMVTIRQAIAQGQSLDPALLDKVLRSETARGGGMLVGSFATIAAGVGLAGMGYFLRLGGQPDALFPLLGVGFMVILIGAALLVGNWLEERRAKPPGS